MLPSTRRGGTVPRTPQGLCDGATLMTRHYTSRVNPLGPSEGRHPPGDLEGLLTPRSNSPGRSSPWEPIPPTDRSVGETTNGTSNASLFSRLA